MSGFIRRFNYSPGLDVLSQIEGVAIIDLPPPGSIQGSEVGVACCVGEFADMTYCTAVDGTGAVVANYRPVEITSGRDLLDKVGGWDETLGDFGDSEGNGFAALRSKSFAALVVVPVNLCSNFGFRFWRELPLCKSQTDVTPVVPVLGASIAAGREFRSASGGRLRVGRRVDFTALPVLHSGTGGTTTNAAAAATQNFTVAGQDFSAVVRADGSGIGIKKGDIIVIGNNNAGAKQPLPTTDQGAGTFRVAADAVSGSPTVLSLELLSGANFAFITAASIPWRIHVSSDADSAPVTVLGATVAGGYKALDAGGASVPCRPLTNFTGAGADGTWTANAPLTPLTVPTALTGDSADPLSGLAGKVHPTQTPAFTQNTQAPNAVAHATIDALYQAALTATVSDQLPSARINIVWCARTSATIRSALRTNALLASQVAAGRVAVIAPDLDTQTLTSAISASSPGVGATRDERAFYTWMGFRMSVPEAVGFRIKTADALTTVDGILDQRSDGLLASVMSLLPPERNPGQAQEPVKTVMSIVLGLQRGAPVLAMGDYIVMKQNGICGIRNDRRSGFVFQSGVTSSLTSGQQDINRRRFADYVQDSVSQRLISYSKLPITQQWKDDAEGEVVAWLESLVSPNNPAQQRIDSYVVDSVSGNTDATRAANVHIIIGKVRMTPLGNVIVFQSEVGNNVVTTTAN